MNLIKYIQERRKVKKVERRILRHRLKKVKVGRAHRTSVETDVFRFVTYATVIVCGAFVLIVCALATVVLGAAGFFWLLSLILGG